MRKYAIAAATALVATVALAAPAAQAGQSITAGGASTQKIIQDACAASYSTDSVAYASTGSGTGRNNFLAGSYDFGGSDTAYAATDKTPENFTYVPVIGVPVAIAFNIPGVKSLELSPKVLAAILNGTYTTWDNPSIKALNSKVNLPSSAITVVYRSGSSGTTQNLARFLAANGGTGWKDNGTWATASSKSNPVGISAANAGAVVSTVASTSGSIGYADLSDVAGKGLNFAAIRNGAGVPVKPTVAASAKFLATQRVSANGILDIDYKASVAGGYNLSLVSYALAPTASTNAAKGTAIRNYLNYVITKCGPAKATSLNYVPLSGPLLVKAKALVAKVK
ncbi:MAG: extracellular solute-binding protein [Micrococcales bacterium]